MRIPITINGKSVILDSDPEQNLLSALRRLKLFSVKCGCCQGLCASCTVLIGDRAVSSYLIPVASVRNQQIITLEYFKQTESYTDIIKGFEKAGVKLCGFCNAGRIFTVHEILETQRTPDRQRIIERIHCLPCVCTRDELMANAVTAAADIRRKRLGSTKYGSR